MSENKNKHLFFSLVYSFQMQGMIQLGKLANPVSGKVEKDLESARMSIDMLDMIKDRMGDNLDEEEKRFISQVTADLKLNFVEESNKDNEKSESKPDAGKESETVSENPGKDEIK